jgi:DNA-binding NarL/FixJ family response regulator
MHPDVVVLDFQRGLRTLGQLVMASPRTRALLMYARCTSDDVAEAVRRGAAGCIPHAVTTELLAKAVRTVASGGAWWGRMALLEALRAQMSVSAPPQHGGSLTQREEEILQLIGHGLSNKEIARRLEISDHTVKTHLHRIYSKLQRSGRYKAYLAQPGAATPDQ